MSEAAAGIDTRRAERQRPARRPALTADEQVGLNGRIAATLTRTVGSMWTVYATLVIVLTWMVLGTWGPLRPVDPYPFQFMLFLGNVAQLLLCFVILVGQRVLGRAADNRSIQTYENAEAIFDRVSELQDHLERHDRMLSQGISLVESRPHPWIGLHRVEEPARASDQAVSVNGRLAAWLTRRMGSMWAFYAAAVFQVAWIGLAQAQVLRFDPYPFSFLLFLSSLVQLVFMLVITVGQEVLGQVADRRSEQTFLNGEAILYESVRMQEHLTAQDRLIESLCTYMRTHVADHIARAIHRSYVEGCVARGEAPSSRSALLPWDELSDELKRSNRDQARHAGEKLAAIGCVMVPCFDAGVRFEFREGEVLLLARMEHERWMADRRRQGFVHGRVRDGQHHPDLVAWEDLSAVAQLKDEQFIKDLPRLLDEAGFQILRLSPSVQ
jgi:uncharacterized membrane protein